MRCLCLVQYIAYGPLREGPSFLDGPDRKGGRARGGLIIRKLSSLCMGKCTTSRLSARPGRCSTLAEALDICFATPGILMSWQLVRAISSGPNFNSCSQSNPICSRKKRQGNGMCCNEFRWHSHTPSSTSPNYNPCSAFWNADSQSFCGAGHDDSTSSLNER